MEKFCDEEESDSPEKWTTITLTRDGCDYIYVVPRSSTHEETIRFENKFCGIKQQKEEFEDLQDEFELLKQELPGLREREDTSEMLILSEATNYVKQLNSLDQLLQRTIMFEECRQEEFFKKLSTYGPAAFENIKPEYSNGENEPEDLSKDFKEFSIESSEESSAESECKQEAVLDQEFLEELNMWKKYASHNVSDSESELTSHVESDSEQDSHSEMDSEVQVNMNKDTQLSERNTGPPFHCKQCKSSFARERQLLGHKCSAKESDFIDPTKKLYFKEEEEIRPKKEINMTDFVSSGSDWKSESSDEENSDLESETEEPSRRSRTIIRTMKHVRKEGQRGKTGILQIGQQKSNFRGQDTKSKKFVVVDENVDLQLEGPDFDLPCSFEKNEGFVPVFSNEEEHIAFQKHIEYSDLSIVDHLFIKAEEGGFCCNFCNLTRKTKAMIRDHCLSHTNFKPYKCPECDVTFAAKRYLLEHMRKHTGNLLECSKCDYKTYRNANLFDHYDTHRNILFICKLCRNHYSSLRNLMGHVRCLHVDREGKKYLKFVKSKLPRRHFCKICKKVVSTKNHVHKTKAHTEPPALLERKVVICNYRDHEWIYVCCVCSHFHSSTACLKNHLQEHIKEADERILEHLEDIDDELSEKSEEVITSEKSNEGESQDLMQPKHPSDSSLKFPDTCLEVSDVSKESVGSIVNIQGAEKSISNNVNKKFDLKEKLQGVDLDAEIFLFTKSLRLSWYLPKVNTFDEGKTTSESSHSSSEDESSHSCDTSDAVNRQAFQVFKGFCWIYKPLNENILQEVIKTSGSVECLHCGKYFADRVTMENHVLTFHEDKEQKCDVCIYTAKKENIEGDPAVDTSRNETNELAVLSGNCKKVVVDKNLDLLTEVNQLNKNPENRKVNTDEVLPAFSTKEKHIAFKKRMDEIDSTFLDHTFSSEERNYVCKKCKKVSKSIAIARRHALVHSDIKPFRCSLCSFYCVCRLYLLEHMRKHTGNLLKCFSCDYTTWHSQSLCRHQKSHSNIILVCKLCSKEYNSLGNLMVHTILEHRDAQGTKYLSVIKSKMSKKYLCSICKKTFVTDNARDIHTALHKPSETNLLTCKFCFATFMGETNLKDHYKKHKVIYVCCLCMKFHSSKACLKKHLKKHVENKDEKLSSDEENDSENSSNQMLLEQQAVVEPHTLSSEKPCDELNLKMSLSSTETSVLDSQLTDLSVESLFSRSLNLSWYIPDSKTNILDNERIAEASESSFSSTGKETNNSCTKIGVPSAALAFPKEFIQLNKDKLNELFQASEKEEECLHCGEHFENKDTLNSHEEECHRNQELACDLCASYKAEKLKKLPGRRNGHLPSEIETLDICYKRVIVDEDTDFLTEEFNNTVECQIEMRKEDTSLANTVKEMEHSASFMKNVALPALRKDPLPPVFSTKKEEESFKEMINNVDLSFLSDMFTTRNGNFSCNICDKVFKTANMIQSHCLTHTDKKPYKCPKCDFRCTKSNYLLVHMRKHTGNILKCSECDYKTWTAQNLYRHHESHANILYVCKLCGKDFNIPKNLVRHVSNHHVDKVGTEYLKVVKSNFSRKYVCKTCPRYFSNEEDRNIHVMCHEWSTTPFESKETACEFCSLTFLNEVDLDNHYEEHKVVYVCAVCHTFHSSSLCLKEHLQGHLTSDLEGLFLESFFTKSLSISWYIPDFVMAKEVSERQENESSSDSLPELEDVHSTAKEVKVPSASLRKIYKPLNKIIFHKVLNSSGKEECVHCGKLFLKKDLLKNHIKKFHDDRNTSCDICVCRSQKEASQKTKTSSELKDSQESIISTKGYKCIVVDEDDDAMEEFDDIIESLFLAQEKLPPVFSTQKDRLEFKKKMDEVSLDFLDCMFSTKPQGKLYYCNFCKMAYRTKIMARKHCLSHTYFKPYKCPQCKLTSAKEYNILQHMRVHTGNWLTCSKCDYRTWLIENLYEHLEFHSNIVFSCKLCHSEHRNIKNLLRHVSHQHKDHLGTKYLEVVESKLLARKTHVCSICKMRFSTNERKKTHVANHHSKTPAEIMTKRKIIQRVGGLKGHKIKDPCKGHRIVYICCICFAFHSSTDCLKKHIQEHCTLEETKKFQLSKKKTSSENLWDSCYREFPVDYDSRASSLDILFARSLRLSWYMPSSETPTETVSKECVFTLCTKQADVGDKKQKFSSAALLHLQKLYKPLNESVFKELTNVGKDECLHCGKYFPNRDLLKSHSLMNHPWKGKKCDLCTCASKKKTPEKKKKYQRGKIIGKAVTSRKSKPSIVPVKRSIAQDGNSSSVKACRKIVVDRDTDLLIEKFKETQKRGTDHENTDIEINDNVEYNSLALETKLPPVFSTREEELVFKNKLEEVDLSSLDCLVSKRETEDEYFCNICSKSLPDLWSIRHHCLTHTDMKPYKCSLCNSSFTLSQTLYEHMRKHTGNMLKCSSCNFTTWLQAHFRQHQDTHLNIIFVCKLCSKEFENIRNLRKHVEQNHTDPSEKDYLAVVDAVIRGGKPYACSICDRSFNKLKLRNRHVRQVHGMSPVSRNYSCCLCSFVSTEEIDLKLHYTKHLFIFICSVCFSAHASVTDLKHHIKVHTTLKSKANLSVDAYQLHQSDFQTGSSQEQLFTKSVCKSWYLAELETSLLGASEEDPLEGTSASGKHQPSSSTLFSEKVNALQKLPSNLHSIVQKKYKPLNKKIFQKMREVMGNEECINCGRCFHKRADLETHILEKHATTDTVISGTAKDGSTMYTRMNYMRASNDENKKRTSHKGNSSICSSPFREESRENGMKTVQTRLVFVKRKRLDAEEHCSSDIKDSRNDNKEKMISDSVSSSKKQRLSSRNTDKAAVESTSHAEESCNIQLSTSDQTEEKLTPFNRDNKAISQNNAVEEISGNAQLPNTETNPEFSESERKEKMARAKFAKYLRRLINAEDIETGDEDSDDADIPETSDPMQSFLFLEETDTLSQKTSQERLNFNLTENDLHVIDETFVPVFSTEEGRLAFEQYLRNVDLSVVDDMFTKHTSKHFSCNLCKKTCKKKNGMRRHCLSHTELRPYKCPNCGSAYNAKDKLLNHMRKHTGNQYGCPKCDFKTDTKMCLVRHYQRAHEGYHTICRLCGKALSDLISLESHINVLHNNNRGKQYLAELKLAKKTASEGMVFRCYICKQEFSTRASRNRHLNAHKDDATRKMNTIQCCLCPFVSTNRNTLKTHFRKHKIAYVCSICCIPFPSCASLQNHLQEHVNTQEEVSGLQDVTTGSDQQSFDKLFTESLSKSWYLSESLQGTSQENASSKADVKTSTWAYRQLYKMFTFFLPMVLQRYKMLDIEIFQKLVASLGDEECMQCGWRCFNSAVLQSHIVSDHAEKELKCDICNYTTMEIQNLQEHVDLNHKGKRISCKHCSFVALSLPSYVTHLKRIHGITSVKQSRMVEHGPDILCPFCGKKYLLPCQLKQHIFLVHRHVDKQEIMRIVKSFSRTPEKLEFRTHTCPYCKKGFIGEKTLERHIWLHEGIKPFKCSLCNFQTRRMVHLKDHMEGHTTEKNFQCDVCHHLYKTELRMKDHRRKVHGKLNDKTSSTFYCDRCDYSTKQRAYFKRHKDTHDGKMIYSCDWCDFNTKYSNSLKAHSEVHRERVLYSCDKCDYDSAKKSQLIVHIRTHEMKSIYSCNECNYMTHDKTRFGKHMAMHAKAMVLNCDKCGYKTRKITFLRKHLSIHGINSLYVCTKCDYTTDFRTDYREHVTNHDPHKTLYWCDACDYNSTQVWNVERHKRVHDGIEQANFVCEKCNYSTCNEYRFKRHMRCHDGRIAYRCYKCDFYVPDRSQLKAHMLVHDKDASVGIKTPYRCTMCGYYAFGEEHLKKHMERHQVIQQLHCEHCEYSSGSIRYMKTHYTRKHRDKPFCLSTFFADPNDIPSYVHSVYSQDDSSAGPESVDQPHEDSYKCLSCSLTFDKGIDLKEHLQTEHEILLESIDFESEGGIQVEIRTKEGEEEPNEMPEAKEENQNVVMIHLQEVDGTTSELPEGAQTIQLMEVDEETLFEEDLIKQINEQDPLDPPVEFCVEDSEGQLVALNSEAIVVEQDGQYVVPDADGSYVIQCVNQDES